MNITFWDPALDNCTKYKNQRNTDHKEYLQQNNNELFILQQSTCFACVVVTDQEESNEFEDNDKKERLRSQVSIKYAVMQESIEWADHCKEIDNHPKRCDPNFVVAVVNVHLVADQDRKC